MSTAELAVDSEMPAPPPPGDQLAAARKSRGLSVAEIAQQLKLSPLQVEAMESGDYRNLPGPVFVRGFMRNYARLVKLDPATLLATAEPHLPRAAPLANSALAQSAEIPFPTVRRIGRAKYAVLAAIVAGALAAYEFYPADSGDDSVKSGQAGLPPPQIGAETAVTPATILGQPATSALVVSVPAPELIREEAGVLPLTAPVRPAPDEQVVRLRFARESWVEIRDRNGRKVFAQLNAPGTEQVVSGLPPLSLIVGNANGVQLTHKEHAVDLAPYIKIDVARLTLE